MCSDNLGVNEAFGEWGTLKFLSAFIFFLDKTWSHLSKTPTNIAVIIIIIQYI